MARDKAVELVLKILHTLPIDCEAEEIPRVPGAKSADIRARVGDSAFLVEVKSRAENEAFAHALDEAEGKIHSRDELITPRMRLADIARGATTQLKATRSSANEFLVLWFQVGNVLGRAHDAELMKYTLFGYRDVAVFHREREMPCIRQVVFPSRAAFCRLTDLDAVITQDGNAISLLANWNSTRLDAFRGSDLYSRFLGLKAVHDPFSPTRGPAPFIIPTEVESAEDSRVLRVVADAAGAIGATYFDMHGFSSAKSISASELSG